MKKKQVTDNEGQKKGIGFPSKQGGQVREEIQGKLHIHQTCKGKAGEP